MIFAITCFSQERVIWGNSVKPESNSEIERIIGVQDSVIFDTRNNQKTFGSSNVFLDVFSVETGNLLRSNAIQLPLVFSAPGNFESVFLFNNQLYLAVSAINIVSKNNNLYLYKLNNNGTVADQGVLLSKVKIDNIQTYGNFQITLTENKEHLLTYFTPSFNANANQKIYFSRWSTTIQKEWQSELELPYTELTFKIVKCLAGNNGNIYLMSENAPNKSGDNNFAGWSYSVVAYYTKLNVIKEYEITLGNNFIISAEFTERNNDLFVAGYYSQNHSLMVDGYFYLRINGESKKIEQQTAMLLPDSLKSKLYNNRANAKGSIRLHPIMALSDGSLRLLGEYYNTYTTDYYDPQTGIITYDNHYYFGNIIILAINVLGELQWSYCINKRQQTVNDEGLFNSFSSISSKNDLLILYNENHQNNVDNSEKSKDIQEMTNPGKADGVAIRLSEQGLPTKTVLFNSNEKSTIFKPTFITRIDDHLTIIFGEKRKSFQIGIFKY